jgi:hypothetical protein
MSSTPPDEPTGPDLGKPPSGPDYGTPPSGPDYGAPPPPGGGYGSPPPPPGGGYGAPPPQPGGYGAPPPGGGYGGPPTGPDQWNIGDALSYGWTKFTQNVGQILLAALILLVASLLSFVVAGIIRAAIGDDNFVMSELSSAVGQIVYSIVLFIVHAAIIRGALDITEGRPFEVGNLFGRLNIGNVIVAGLLVSAIVFVGTLLCILPGIVAWFMLLFTPFFVVDKDLPAVEAVKACFAFTRNNLGNMILWFIVGGIVYLVGYCIICVGVLVTAPVVLIGAAFTYKKLTGQPVAP